jgi:hypothetical protein
MLLFFSQRVREGADGQADWIREKGGRLSINLFTKPVSSAVIFLKPTSEDTGSSPTASRGWVNGSTGIHQADRWILPSWSTVEIDNRFLSNLGYYCTGEDEADKDCHRYELYQVQGFRPVKLLPMLLIRIW